MKFRIGTLGLGNFCVGIIFAGIGLFSISGPYGYSFDDAIIFGIGVLLIMLGIGFLGIKITKGKKK